MEGVCDHTPREALLIDGSTTFLDILSHQRLTTRNDYKHLMWIGLFRDSIEHSQEVLLQHILALGLHLTVAATMAALQITAQRTLPEQLSQGMLLGS